MSLVRFVVLIVFIAFIQGCGFGLKSGDSDDSSLNLSSEEYVKKAQSYIEIEEYENAIVEFTNAIKKIPQIIRHITKEGVLIM